MPYLTPAHEALLAAHEAEVARWDAFMPGWETDEARHAGEILSEWDFPVYEETEVSDEDWQVFIEMTFVDPAEREA